MGSGALDDMYALNPETGSWTALTSKGEKPSPRFVHKLVKRYTSSWTFVFVLDGLKAISGLMGVVLCIKLP